MPKNKRNKLSNVRVSGLYGIASASAQTVHPDGTIEHVPVKIVKHKPKNKKYAWLRCEVIGKDRPGFADLTRLQMPDGGTYFQRDDHLTAANFRKDAPPPESAIEKCARKVVHERDKAIRTQSKTMEYAKALDALFNAVRASPRKGRK